MLDIGIVMGVADIFYALVGRRLRPDAQLGLLSKVVHDYEVLGLLSALLYYALDTRLPICKVPNVISDLEKVVFGASLRHNGRQAHVLIGSRHNLLVANGGCDFR